MSSYLEKYKTQLAELGTDFSEAECTYYLCPDSACDLFYDPGRFPCEHACPKKAKKMIICFHCKAEIVLPNDHFSFCRVECECGACNFHRMSEVCRLIRL